MNYQKHYDLLIERARNRTGIISKRAANKILGYNEAHHIIPKCMGGPNTLENKVYFYPREHYIAHQLLVKIYPKVWGLKHTLILFDTSHKDMIRNNRVYEWIRRQHAQAISERMKGKAKSEEHKAKLREVKGEKHHGYGKKRDEEVCQNTSLGLKAYWDKVKSGEIERNAKPYKKGQIAWNKGLKGATSHSEETKRKISETMKIKKGATL